MWKSSLKFYINEIYWVFLFLNFDLAEFCIKWVLVDTFIQDFYKFWILKGIVLKPTISYPEGVEKCTSWIPTSKLLPGLLEGIHMKKVNKMNIISFQNFTLTALALLTGWSLCHLWYGFRQYSHEMYQIGIKLVVKLLSAVQHFISIVSMGSW